MTSTASAPAPAAEQCRSRGCIAPHAEGSAFCATHTAMFAEVRATVQQPWNFKERRPGVRRRRSAR